MYLKINAQLLALNPPLVMGILNVTQDSFYDGGVYLTEREIVERVEKMICEGADIIDLGAVSTRPGSTAPDIGDEMRTIRFALNTILKKYPNITLSIDTWRAAVAEMAVGEGASMINDISGGTFDPMMIPLIGKLKVPYCLMHTIATPDVMQHATNYKSILSDILHYFGLQIMKLKDAGANDIIIDPGFGFCKTQKQNYFILDNLKVFSTLHHPILIGLSRKSMIYNLLGNTPEDALNGTTVLNVISLLKGAHILRVHDVKEAKEAVKIVYEGFENLSFEKGEKVDL